MLKKERNTLKIIRKNFGMDSLIYFNPDTNSFICDSIIISCKYPDTASIIHSLSYAGFLIEHSHPTDLYFSLTYDGYNHFLILLDRFRISFFTKWIPGFISGVVSAILVEYLIRRFL